MADEKVYAMWPIYAERILPFMRWIHEDSPSSKVLAG